LGWQAGVLYDRERLLQRVGRFYGSDTQGDVDGMRKLNGLLSIPFVTVEMIFYQDRLGTNTEKHSKKDHPFSQVGCRGSMARVGKVPFLRRVCTKKDRFAKTRSG
jgi:hypothetical protein